MPNFVSLTAVNTETRLSFEKSSSNFEKKRKNSDKCLFISNEESMRFPNFNWWRTDIPLKKLFLPFYAFSVGIFKNPLLYCVKILRSGRTLTSEPVAFAHTRR